MPFQPLQLTGIDCAYLEIGLWYRSESKPELLDILGWNKLQIAAFERVYTHPKTQLSHLSSRCLLQHLGLQPNKDRWGKPYLSDSRLHISLSHCDDWGAVAICSQPVGLDVEKAQSKLRALQNKFVDADFSRYLHNLQPSTTELEQLLARYWAGKEAVYKLQGQPIADFAQGVKIRAFGLGKKQQTLAYLQKTATFAAHKLHFSDLGCNYSLALCL